MNMKKIAIIGVIALVVIGCVLAAGCTSSTTTSTTSQQQSIQTPTVNQSDANGVTNYSNSKNWLFYEQNPDADVDLFYIYPTVITETDNENGVVDISPEMRLAALDAFVSTGSAFGPYTNVFAPLYRQLGGTYELQAKSHDELLDMIRNSEGVKDIYASLDYYFKNANNGRPFILAGHSQGSGVLQIVLEDYMKKHPEYYKNMVAAYVIGFGVTQDWLNANPHLKFAQGENDTGVIISWNTEGPGATKENFLLGENAVVINPLNWKTDETYAGKLLNKGSQEENILGYLTAVPKLNDAQIDSKRGALICTTESESNYSPVEKFGEKSLHSKDYALYYANLTENGLKRIQAFLGNKKA